MANRYLTTTLPYVNSDPHIGFALELVQADALVRFWKSQGDEVFFNTGTDEHGQKIWEAAEKAGDDVKVYADRYANEFKKLTPALGISEDIHFIRTTDAHHVAAAQEMWKRCSEKGDIEMRSYTGLYCVGCEAYKTEREIENGHCIIHPNLELKETTEKNYFFKLSNYKKDLEAYLGREDSVVPSWRREEALAIVRELEDISISREKEKLSWGIPVPGDDAQVMYVWFEALVNYISTLGWPDEKGDFKKFWLEGETLQMAGKDQVRFQSVIFQGMLMSAGIKNTGQVFYHGFINSGGQKMSKSLGNVISPYDLVKKYGTEATRYLLLRHVHSTEDTDVTWERLDEWYTAGLVNGIGNLVARTMKLAETNLEGGGVEVVSDRFKLNGTLEKFQFNQALDLVWEWIQILDNKIATEQPYKMLKDNPEAGKKVLKECVEDLYVVAFSLKSFMPETSKKILDAVRENKKPENLFPRLG